MSEYVGSVGDKICVKVTLVNRFEKTSYKFSYYGQTTYTYLMEDENGNVLVWKTGSLLDYPQENDQLGFIRKGDCLEIRGTVKEQSEYKGQKQTVLTRCRYTFISSAPVKQIKREQQIQSLKDGDHIFNLPYRSYKEHYADCETLAGSYDEEERTISVIVRKGRLKPSGVRGQHFSGYQFRDQNGKIVCYRAVCTENALRRAEKDFPDSEWELDRIYAY